MTSSVSTKTRIRWIDCAKGIGIFLVIIGHSIARSGSTPERYLRALIFSMHMPLFFALSQMTSRFSENEGAFVKKTERAFKHLALPALFVYILRMIIYILRNPSLNMKKYLAERITVFCYASGANVKIADTKIASAGMMWFLIALFIGRTMFDYMHLKLSKKAYNVSVFLCVIIGCIFSRIQWLPFCFDIVLVILIFFYIGELLKRYDFSSYPLIKCMLSCGIWVITLGFTYRKTHDYLELSARHYPLLPLCFITAAAGIIAMAYISRFIDHIPLVSSILAFFGKNSLILFAVHAMDYLWKSCWDISGSGIVNGIVRTAIDCLLCLGFRFFSIALQSR